MRQGSGASHTEVVTAVVPSDPVAVPAGSAIAGVPSDPGAVPADCAIAGAAPKKHAAASRSAGTRHADAGETRLTMADREGSAHAPKVQLEREDMAPHKKEGPSQGKSRSIFSAINCGQCRPG